MIRFQGAVLSEKEKLSFINLLKKELEYSRQLEEMLMNSRSKNRKHYFILQNELYMEQLD
jgi:hypothetical protein